MMANASCLPTDVAAKLDAFCAAVKAGRVILDINDHRVVGWEFVEKGRVRADG